MQSRRVLGGILLVCVFESMQSFGQDLLNDHISFSGLTLHLVEYAQMPPGPSSSILSMTTQPTNDDRLFVTTKSSKVFINVPATLRHPLFKVLDAVYAPTVLRCWDPGNLSDQNLFLPLQSPVVTIVFVAENDGARAVLVDRHASANGATPRRVLCLGQCLERTCPAPIAHRP